MLTTGRMKSLKSLLVALACLSTTSINAAQPSDTPTELSGTFSVSGSNVWSFVPTAFIFLPGGSTDSIIAARNSGGIELGFGSYFAITSSPGLSGWFFNQPISSTDIGSYSGSYLRGGQTVDWSLTGLQSSVSTETFSGNFSFQVRSSVPDGGSTAAILGVALVGLVALRRRFRA